MADRYWVGGGDALWNANAGTKWATTSGGVGGSAVPVAGDDVYFDAVSPSCQIAQNVVCRKLDCTGFTNTLNYDVGTRTISIGTSSAGAGNIALKFVAGMTYTSIGSGNVLNFSSTVASTTMTIDFAGKTIGNAGFVAATTSGYQLVNAASANPVVSQTSSSSTFTTSQGGLDLNNHNISVGRFLFTTTGTKTLTMGSSTISITSVANGSNAWDINAGGTTITLNTATVAFVGTASATIFNGNVTDYNGMSIVMNQDGRFTITGSDFTCANVTRTATTNVQKLDTMLLGCNVTCTGTFTAAGNSLSNRLFVASNIQGTQRTITAAAVTLTSGVDFRDIIGAGAGSWTGTSIGDAQGNSGITFTTPVTRYWRGDANNSLWSNTSSWSATSGGSTGATVPLAQDTVIFDNNSLSANRTGIKFDMLHLGTVNMSAMTSWTIGIARPAGGFICYYYGNCDISRITTHSTTSWTPIVLVGRGTFTFKPPTSTFSQTMAVAAFGGTYSLAASWTVPDNSSVFRLEEGTFNCNGFNLTFGSIQLQGPVTTLARTMVLGTGVVTVNASGTPWNVVAAPSLTLDTTGSTINFGVSSASGKTFNGGGYTYNDVVIPPGGAGACIFQNSNIYRSINMTVVGTKTLQFGTASLHTITGGANSFVSGTSGNLVTVTSAVAGIPAQIKKVGVPLSLDYLSVQDINGAIPEKIYFGTNSTDVSGNTNVAFTTPISHPLYIHDHNDGAYAAVATSFVLPILNPVTAGQLIFVAFNNHGANPGAVTISGYTAGLSVDTASPSYTRTFYKIAAGGETSITVNTANSTSNTDLHVVILAGFTGIPTLDVTDSNIISSGTSGSTAGSAPSNTVAPAIAMAFFGMPGNISNTVSTTNGYGNVREQSENARSRVLSKRLTTTGAQSTTLTWTTARVAAAQLLVFKDGTSTTNSGFFLLMR